MDLDCPQKLNGHMQHAKIKDMYLLGELIMGKIISIHEYKLKNDISHIQFEDAIQHARDIDLFNLPGLQKYYFLRHLQGTRKVEYAAVWIYESKDSWIRLWGTKENPKPKNEYPFNWNVWEDEILAPLLSQEPDRIFYAAYEEF